MSLGNTYPVTYVKQYASNVYHLSQQKESRLRSHVKFDSFIGEGKFYDRLGETEVYEKTGRYSDTKWVDVEWSRRRLNFRDYRFAHPVDQADKLRLIHNPESEISMAARKAFGRRMKLSSVQVLALHTQVKKGLLQFLFLIHKKLLLLMVQDLLILTSKLLEELERSFGQTSLSLVKVKQST